MSKRFESATAYPLSWPDNIPLHKSRVSSTFKATLAQALDNVTTELERFASTNGKPVKQVIISSNYSLTDRRPDNPGVAVYFTWDNERTCIAVDRYNKIECNLQAIYHCINADRTKHRHGGINIVKAAFRGYAALPNPDTLNWRDVLGDKESDTLADVKLRYKKLIAIHHPDKDGGSEYMASRINKAWELAQRELSP